MVRLSTALLVLRVVLWSVVLLVARVVRLSTELSVLRVVLLSVALSVLRVELLSVALLVSLDGAMVPTALLANTTFCGAETILPSVVSMKPGWSPWMALGNPGTPWAVPVQRRLSGSTVARPCRSE